VASLLPLLLPRQVRRRRWWLVVEASTPQVHAFSVSSCFAAASKNGSSTMVLHDQCIKAGKAVPPLIIYRLDEDVRFGRIPWHADSA
jgi:hypothetical protein